MFKNYLKIALRQLGKQKFYSAIKIGGFALGIAACLLIALYIRSELSYDRDYPDTGRLYRVIEIYDNDGTISKGPAFPAPFAQALQAEFPQVEKAGRIMPYPLFSGAGSNEVRPGNKVQNTYEEGFSYADQSMLDMFQFPMVYGDRAHALTEPGNVVISKRKADKYFPHETPVGKVIYLNDDKTRPYKIGGVMQDRPANSHLQYDFLLSLAGHELWNGEQQTWMADNYNTYVRLRPGVNAVQLQGKLKVLYQKYLLPGLLANGTKDPQKIIDASSFELQPVKDIHLLSYDIHDSFTHGDMRFIWLFAAVGCFILLLACINFINLSTARSASRAKEVGLRKVVGSRRIGLIRQFLTESLVMSLFSFLLALALAWLLLPLFNQLTATSLSIPWTQWRLLPVLVLAAVVVGLLAGLYPSFYLSGFRPAEALKGRVSPGSRASGLRSVLVVFQFAASVILIIATFVVYRQMRFIMDKKMGFDKDQVMLVQGTGVLDKQLPAFKTELLKLPDVMKVSVSDFLPVAGGKRNMNSFWKAGREKLDARVGAQSWWVDPDYIPTMGMKMVQGRNFSAAMASDSTGIVINETMAKQLGVKDPLGQLITNGGNIPMHVVGVVGDFNYESVKDEIGPLVLHRGSWSTVVAVKANSANFGGLVKQVADVWKSFAPRQELRYTFLDDSFARMYADVQRTGSLFTALSTMAIVIACLGLFALSAFMAEQRRKEIGIRKVLGATVGQLAGLLSKDFLKLVMIAIFVASPIAYWAMHKWLQDYQYRIDIGVWVFVGSGALVVMIALLTISFQAMKAALANPAVSLKAE
jgi:putative ABC transport system permease protein